jgi:hypothetical protein
LYCKSNFLLTSLRAFIYLSKSIVNITDSGTFELCVIKDDLMVNPIPEKSPQIKSQAQSGDGLCTIQIPTYTDTEAFLSTVQSSVTGNDCGITICRAEGCIARLANNTKIMCNATSSCDEMKDIEEYMNCDCDVVVTADGDNNFALYTGKL